MNENAEPTAGQNAAESTAKPQVVGTAVTLEVVGAGGAHDHSQVCIGEGSHPTLIAQVTDVGSPLSVTSLQLNVPFIPEGDEAEVVNVLAGFAGLLLDTAVAHAEQHDVKVDGWLAAAYAARQAEFAEPEAAR